MDRLENDEIILDPDYQRNGDLWDDDTQSRLIESLIIGIVTFFICLIGLAIGKKFGTKLSSKASILGGVILMAIGLEIFITSFIWIDVIDVIKGDTDLVNNEIAIDFINLLY